MTQIQKSKLAAIYVRVSGERQKKEETIESQIDAIQDYARANNYSIMKEWIFKDEATSGQFLNRPGLDALRDLARDGDPDIIIIHEPDRLARKTAYQTLLLEEFEKNGTPVQFVKVKRPETAEEQLALNMLGAFAEYEHAKITDRCRRGRLYKAKMGKVSVLPHAPYGYNYIKVDNTASFRIDPEKSIIVKEIFSLYAHSQYSLGAIGKHLDQKGIPTPKNGKRWDRSTIRDMLKNETYIGTAYFGKTEKCDGIPDRIIRINGKKISKSYHARRERSKEAWIPISVPGFISESDFQLVQEKLETNKKLSRRNTKELSLLQGILVCELCGCSFYKKLRTSSKHSVHYYCCRSVLEKHLSSCGNRALKQPELDLAVWNEVIQLLKNPRLLEQEIARRVNESKHNIDKHIKKEKIEKELKQLSKAKDKLLDAYQEGDCLTLDELRPRMEKLKKKIIDLEKNLQTLELLKEQQEKNIDFKSTLKHLEKRLLASADDLSVAEKQKIIRLLVEEVKISRESITIKHCIPSYVETNQDSPLCGVRC